MGNYVLHIDVDRRRPGTEEGQETQRRSKGMDGGTKNKKNLGHDHYARECQARPTTRHATGGTAGKRMAPGARPRSA